MPMLAGPGSMSLLIAYYQELKSSDGFISTSEIISACAAILVVAIIIFVILRSAYFLSKILGNSGIIAISRIVGFLTIAIGIQYIISAILSIVRGI
jgi:small neutral amino acid transporter SnatA (MarC family)